MSLTLRELAERLGAELVGDPGLTVDHPAGLADADATALTFLANPKYAAQLAATAAAAAVVAPDVDAAAAPCALLRAAHPDLAFARACALLCPPPPPPPPGAHPLAYVDPSAKLGAGVSVGPFAVVGRGATVGNGTILHPHAVVGDEAAVGAECELFPHAVLYPRVRLGDRVILHAGAVLGSDGFGYMWNGTRLEKVPQVGGVLVGDDVEIGAGSAIDRARLGDSVVGTGTKIDNLVHLAHNVKIGRHCALAAQTGIAGSTTVGDGVRMAGQAGVVGHIAIGDGATISAKTGVMNHVPAGEQQTGIPARPHRKMLEQWALTENLAKMRERLRAAEKRLALLEKSGSSVQ